MIRTNWIYMYISTIFKLGIFNVFYVAYYRFTIYTGIRKLFFPQVKNESNGNCYHEVPPVNIFPDQWKQPILNDSNKILGGFLHYYKYHWKELGTPPDWFLNPFNGKRHSGSNLHWTKIPDFNRNVGDIKNIWEASRLEWLITLGRAYVITGENIFLTTLNKWLSDWSEKNPQNTGPNWKCGQEASIRLFNLINTACILRQIYSPNLALTDLVYIHLKRISINILYAVAQNNNHGTSEATGLFIGGSWLALIDGKRYVKAQYYATQGRKWLENRVNKLIENDGSFSQHSVTYHRVLLDTLCFAEYWRDYFHLAPFSDCFYWKVKLATDWLWSLTDEITGNCPNLGANDGSMLLNTHSCDYRDFRPSIQLASLLFGREIQYESGLWDEPLFWFNIKKNPECQNLKCRTDGIKPGGYVVMISDNSWGMLRFPSFKFKPSHNDVFHIDLWHFGKNIIHDCGSYSYNADIQSFPFNLKSVNSHNTASFDGLEQMVILRRFLLGKWIDSEFVSAILNLDENIRTWAGSYFDSRKNRHQRTITWVNDTWTIIDKFSGRFQLANIGFNLIHADYQQIENAILAPWGEISYKGVSEMQMIESICSDYYWEKHPCKRLVLWTDENKMIETRIIFNNESSTNTSIF